MTRTLQEENQDGNDIRGQLHGPKDAENNPPCPNCAQESNQVNDEGYTSDAGRSQTERLSHVVIHDDRRDLTMRMDIPDMTTVAILDASGYQRCADDDQHLDIGNGQLALRSDKRITPDPARRTIQEE